MVAGERLAVGHPSSVLPRWKPLHTGLQSRARGLREEAMILEKRRITTAWSFKHKVPHSSRGEWGGGFHRIECRP
jgi:hypothetical protein